MSAGDKAAIQAATEQLTAAILAAVRAELARETPSGPRPERLLSIDEAAAALGIGRTALYNELRACRLHSLKVGRRRLIPESAITAYIEALTYGEGRGSR